MTLRPSFLASCILTAAVASACGDTHPSSSRADNPQPDAETPASDSGVPGDDDDPADAGPDAGDGDAGDGDAGDGGAGDGDAGDGDANGDPTPARWYKSRVPVELSVAGPFGDAFRAAFAGQPDGIFPPVRVKDPFEGGLVYQDIDGESRASQSEPVTLSVRGQSSLQECAFPKFKWAFAKRITAPEDLFVSTKKMKVGTHCGEDEGDAGGGVIGRLRNEKASWREDLVYQLAHTLDIVTLQTRPAVITYTDTSTEPAFEPGRKRKAFLLEHIDELAHRLGAVSLPNPRDCGAPKTQPKAADVLRIKFFHAMVGNWDFTLGSPKAPCDGPLHNTEVLTFADGSVVLVPADFDLSALVVGQVRDPDSQLLEPIDAANAIVAAGAYLLSNLTGESAEAIEAMKTEYLAKKAALHATIDASPADAAGKAYARHLVDGFFAALAGSK